MCICIFSDNKISIFRESASKFVPFVGSGTFLSTFVTGAGGASTSSTAFGGGSGN